MSNHSKYPNEAGIYKITCISNGKVYIGKSINLRKRINFHKSQVKKLRGMWYFQNALIKHGWESFEVEILEIFDNFDKLLDNKTLLDRESFYIEKFDSTNKDKGYNRCKYSTDTTGKKLSEEHKEKIRQSCLGNTHTEETKEKIRNSAYDRKHSEKSKEKMRKPKSEEHVEKMRKPKSDETKERMRLSKLGKPLSEEHKEKLRKPKTKRKQKYE